MNVLFLDVDGVIRNHTDKGFSQEKVNNLVRILRETKCKIVLSSGWRLPTLAQTSSSNFGRILREMDFGLYVLNSVIDVTPEGYSRAEEIRTWLQAQSIGNITKYAILDDEDVSVPHLFKTEYSTGLTPEIAEAIIKHFNER